jgi:hypothetical protein
MGSTPPPPLILQRLLPVAMPKQSMSPGHLLRCHPNGLPPLLLVPQATENGRKQPPHARIPVAPAQFCHHAPSAIARAPRHGSPAKIVTQAMGNAPIRLPPTMQSSVTPITNISQALLRYEKLWYLFYRYLRVPPGTTQKSTAQKCNILLSIEIHDFRDPTGIVKYGHVS